MTPVERGPSLWLDYDYCPRPPLHGTHHCDVVVIGGGICGISAALHAARMGFSVMVVESRVVAWGATGRNAGFILAGVAERHSRVAAMYGRERANTLWATTLENHQLMAEEISRSAIPCEYRLRGSIQLSNSGDEDAELRESAELLAQDGFAGHFLEPHEVPEVYRGAGFGGALVIPTDGELDPARFVRGAAEVAEAEGVKIFENTPVMAMDTATQGEVVVETSEGRIHAMVALLCTNAHAAELVPWFEHRVMPTRGQMLATAPAPLLFDCPVYANHGFDYWRQTVAGRIVIGGWRYLDTEGEVGTRDHVHGEIQGAMERFLARFPGLQGVEITHRWSGIMGFSSDGLCQVGAVPGQPGLLAAVGFTGHGFGFAWAAGKSLAQLLAEGRSALSDLLPPRRLSGE